MTLKSGLEVTQDHSTGTILKLVCGFLFPFHSNYGSVMHQFGNKARYCSQIVIKGTALQMGREGGKRMVRKMAVPSQTKIMVEEVWGIVHTV